MASADDLLRQGDLDGARAALVEVVRARPADPEPRIFLFSLLSLIGDWDKARTHLEMFARLSKEPDAQMLGSAYSQALEAERFRAAVFAGEADAPILARDCEWAKDISVAIRHYAKGDAQAGDEARARAFDAAPDTPGKFNDEPFEWIGDADARFGPVFEVILAGQWGLMPFAAIEKVTSEGPKDLRDLVWYPVQVGTLNGQSAAGLMPMRYPGSEKASDPAERLGRATGWQAGPSGDVGLGQHLLSLSSGDERGLLELRQLTIG